MHQRNKEFFLPLRVQIGHYRLGATHDLVVGEHEAVGIRRGYVSDWKTLRGVDCQCQGKGVLFAH